MNTTCPNCGADHSELVRGPGKEQWICKECGTRWIDGLWKSIPRRSRPAEVKELPDAEGIWSRSVFKGPPVRIVMEKGKPFYADTGTRVGKGPWVQWGPPIVQPKPKDEDVEWLRKQAEICNLDAIGYVFDKERAPRLLNIADRLEQLAEGKQ